MPRKYRPTVALTVRIGLEARQLLELVAAARELTLSATVERLVDEEARRLGPKKKARPANG